MKLLKSSNDWYDLVISKGITVEILRPTGWGTGNLGYAFQEKIDFNEFQQRLLSSTIYSNNPNKLMKILEELIITKSKQ